MRPWPCDLPVPHELRHASELGCLALLDAALVAAGRALVAAEPELERDGRARHAGDRNLPARYHFACTVLTLADALRIALAAYRRAVDDDFSDTAAERDDIPF